MNGAPRWEAHIQEEVNLFFKYSYEKIEDLYSILFISLQIEPPTVL